MLIYTFLYRFAIEQSPTLLQNAGSEYSPAELFLPWGESFSPFVFLFWVFFNLWTCGRRRRKGVDDASALALEK